MQILTLYGKDIAEGKIDAEQTILNAKETGATIVIRDAEEYKGNVKFHDAMIALIGASAKHDVMLKIPDYIRKQNKKDLC